MEDFLKSVLIGCHKQLEEQSDELSLYFETVIKPDDEHMDEMEMLQLFKPVHSEFINVLNGQMQTLSGLEVMGFGDEDDEPDSERMKIAQEIARTLEVITIKLELILEYLVDLLGEDVVVEVLELE